MILLKSIPKVDKFIKHKSFENCSTKLISQIVKEIITQLREDILDKKIETIDEDVLVQKVLNRYEDILNPSLQNVINATGVIVHTNLGRSLIDDESFESKKDSNFNNLEYDLKGVKGVRDTPT